MRSTSKPVVLLHLGMDRNPQDYAQPINYRTFKVWSLQRWTELVDKLKSKYTFVQVSNGQDNPDIPNVPTSRWIISTLFYKCWNTPSANSL